MVRFVRYSHASRGFCLAESTRDLGETASAVPTAGWKYLARVRRAREREMDRLCKRERDCDPYCDRYGGRSDEHGHRDRRDRRDSYDRRDSHHHDRRDSYRGSSYRDSYRGRWGGDYASSSGDMYRTVFGARTPALLAAGRRLTRRRCSSS